VNSFDELDRRASEVKGKIVVYNEEWAGSYDQTVVYRTSGPMKAQQYGNTLQELWTENVYW